MKYILLIEDDQDLQAALGWVLESQGYRVIILNNGFEGLEYLKKTRDFPTLILLDIMMPVMDGFELRILQQQNPKFASIPTIVMTADIHVEKQFVKNENETFLKKPIAFDKLLDIVKTIY